jgi:sucrose phosphorylase
MLLARALQLFMPGKPQVWYLDLFAGTNDHEAVKRAGAGGHKEINRTNLSLAQLEEKLGQDVVSKQVEMLKFRNIFPAFGFESAFDGEEKDGTLRLTWKKDGYSAELVTDLVNETFEITAVNPDGTTEFHMASEK